MERQNRGNNFIDYFFLSAIITLLLGGAFGVTGALQYVVPGLFKNHLSFERVRPLHVTSVIFWIMLSAQGIVLKYLQQHTGRKIKFNTLLIFQFLFFAATFITAAICYCMGIFGGREYWEFPPFLGIMIGAGWIFFLINFISTVSTIKNQPVYIWMWLTGIIFFIFTYAESYLWLFKYFRGDIINDITIQWKANGAMVGAWNMLIYGSAIFLMDKYNGSKKYSDSTIGFALYFTGLLNLMFNWGHHIYTVPTHSYIHYVSYIISMTELIILARIIWQWKENIIHFKKKRQTLTIKFLMNADVWILFTLILAIIMSVPAINMYTHGTHITVAHSMGATIGINSFLLFAILFDIIPVNTKKKTGRIVTIMHHTLIVFFVTLILAGIAKSYLMLNSNLSFHEMMLQLRSLFIISFITEIILLICIYAIGITLLNAIVKKKNITEPDHIVLHTYNKKPANIYPPA